MLSLTPALVCISLRRPSGQTMKSKLGMPHSKVRQYIRCVMPTLAMFDSSCPRMSQAFTPWNASPIKDVDGPQIKSGGDKPGHDVDRAAIVTKIGIMQIWGVVAS